jgi:hypothetical protein
MEQVLAPNFRFKTKQNDDDKSTDTEIKVRGLKEPSSKRVKDIIESDLNDLKAAILSDDKIVKALPGNVDPEVINKVMIPKIIKIKYPQLNDEEVEELRQHVVVDSVIKNGHQDTALEALEQIQAGDEMSGYLYILQSFSQVPEIANTKNLYKIGYSTVPVQERVKNAVDEPTFLMDKVRIISAFECYNLNPQKLELLLPTFFGSSCLNVDVYDKQGKRFSPREWFIAPLHIIEKAAAMLINSDIVNYRYDVEKQTVEER